MIKTLALMMTLAACGDGLNGPPEPDAQTWGRASGRIAEEYCDGLGVCGWEPAKVLSCKLNAAYDLCDAQDNCDLELTPSQADEAALCADELERYPCYKILFGSMPDVCYRIIGELGQ
jgi:hypothetical protein